MKQVFRIFAVIFAVLIINGCIKRYERSDQETSPPWGHQELCESTDPERAKDRELFCD